MPPAMDIDEEDEGTQRPLQARDYGIEVDFDDLSEEERDVRPSSLSPLCSCCLTYISDRGSDLTYHRPPFSSSCLSLACRCQDGSDEYGAELEETIVKLVADITRMAPNMKAAEKLALHPSSLSLAIQWCRMTDRVCVSAGWVASRPS